VQDSLKIDPQIPEDSKGWAATNHINFLVMVEALLKAVVDGDRAKLKAYRKKPKTTQEQFMRALFDYNTPAIEGVEEKPKRKKK
jgi:hypothetical protein